MRTRAGAKGKNHRACMVSDVDATLIAEMGLKGFGVVASSVMLALNAHSNRARMPLSVWLIFLISLLPAVAQYVGAGDSFARITALVAEAPIVVLVLAALFKTSVSAWLYATLLVPAGLGCVALASVIGDAYDGVRVGLFVIGGVALLLASRAAMARKSPYSFAAMIALLLCAVLYAAAVLLTVYGPSVRDELTDFQWTLAWMLVTTIPYSVLFMCAVYSYEIADATTIAAHAVYGDATCVRADVFDAFEYWLRTNNFAVPESALIKGR